MSPRGVYVHTKEYRLKQSISHMGTQPCLGNKLSEEHRKKLSEVRRGRPVSDETRYKISKALTGRNLTEEAKRKLSATLQGVPLDEWTGDISYEPYCPLFNEKKKEDIRNRDNRVCQLCGKAEILNGSRLSVHHIDGNKMQGCNDAKWHLCALCKSCNTKPDTIEKEFLIISNLSRRLTEQ